MPGNNRRNRVAEENNEEEPPRQRRRISSQRTQPVILRVRTYIQRRVETSLILFRARHVHTAYVNQNGDPSPEWRSDHNQLIYEAEIPYPLPEDYQLYNAVRHASQQYPGQQPQPDPLEHYFSSNEDNQQDSSNQQDSVQDNEDNPDR